MRHVTALVVGVVLAAPACAPGSGTHDDAEITASPVTVVPETESGARSASPGEPGDGLGRPVEVEAGKVTVSLSADSFRHGQVISLLIANGFGRVLHAEDSKTDCTIALLQRKQAAEWADIPACAVMRPPVTWAIGPGRGRTVSFDPRSANFAALGQQRLAPSPGTYRVKFTFRLGSEPAGEERHVACSPPFTIR